MTDLREVLRKKSKGTLKRFRYEANHQGTSTLAETYHPEVDFSEISIEDFINVLNEMLGPDHPPKDDVKIYN